MNFQSDNAAAACPEVIDALIAANQPTTMAYDGDPWSARLDAVYGEFFGHACTVLPVSTGSAANALGLAAMVPPYGAVVAHTEAHIHVDECGAPEFFTGGAKILLVDGAHGKLTPDGITAGLAAHRGDVHQVQIRVLSLTQATECGTVYSPDELLALGDYARARSWRVQLDGARFANALSALGCHPGDMSWRAGVDVLSMGVIKNGGLSAEALVVFAPELVAELRFRRKRAGQMPSKGRFNAAQLLAYVETGAWRRNAARANAGAAKLASAASDRLLHPVEGNEVFVRLGGSADAATLRDAGFSFYDWGAAGSGEARFVVAWDTPDAHIAALATALDRQPYTGAKSATFPAKIAAE
jgi:threonine aldolase